MDQVSNLVWAAVAAALAGGGLWTCVVVRGRRKEKAAQKAYDAAIREEARRLRRRK